MSKINLFFFLPAFLALSAAEPAPTLLLFFDKSRFTSFNDTLALRVNQPAKGPRVLQPDKPWESWAVFAYNHVVEFSPPPNAEYRMYYDCIEGDGVPPGSSGRRPLPPGAPPLSALSHRRICLATSTDGLVWTKPNLGIFARNGSTANNILLEDSGVTVFRDGNPAAPASQRWKMTCSRAAYASPDGLRWAKLPWNDDLAEDDTKPTANWDPRLGKYVVMVRRDLPGARTRFTGRCVTSNLSHWQQELPPLAKGCDVVFGPDDRDPATTVDVYTNAWTPYPSMAAPVVHLQFPSFYHHFGRAAPWGFGNDGLLDIRLAFAHGAAAAPSAAATAANTNAGAGATAAAAAPDYDRFGYAEAPNARAPFVSLGPNSCGDDASAPSTPGGWCSPHSGVESRAAFDTSAMYMASGYVPSADGGEVFLYASGQPMTHGGDGANRTWGANTGIRVLRLRRDGFVAVEAPYTFAPRLEDQPAFTTVEVEVPKGCPPPNSTGGGGGNVTACAYNVPGGDGDTCPSGWTNPACTANTDCVEIPGAHPTCEGSSVTCVKGRCEAAGVKGGLLCVHAAPPRVRGGVQLLVNAVTSVVGWVRVGLLAQGGTGPVPGMALADADPIVGNALAAAASWQGGALASLSALAGTKVALRVAMADAKLFSLKLACAAAH